MVCAYDYARSRKRHVGVDVEMLKIFSLSIILVATFFLGNSPAFSGDDKGFCLDSSSPKHASHNAQVKLLFVYCPKVEDISIGSDSIHKLYSGQWFNKKKPALDLYSQTPEGLNISLGGSISTVNMRSKQGGLPLIPGRNGFYIEFLARIDDASKDHFPALWLNPVEHNAKEDDRAFSNDRLEQHWMELDVDEGGYQDGMLGTVHEWHGNFPNYQRKQSSHPASKKLDRTKFHTFAAYYDPFNSTVKWWIDDELHNEASAPLVGSNFHYHVIMSAQTHGKNEPYKLIVKRVRVFVPE